MLQYPFMCLLNVVIYYTKMYFTSELKGTLFCIIPISNSLVRACIDAAKHIMCQLYVFKHLNTVKTQEYNVQYNTDYNGDYKI
jgi:hypothetical protein